MSDYDTRRHDERLTAVMLMKISIGRHPELDSGSAFLVREVQQTLSFLRVTFGTADPVLTCVRMTKRQGDEAVAPPPQKGYSSMTQRMYEQVLAPL